MHCPIRKDLPLGYFWKDAAKNVRCIDREFKKHAVIWSGRIQNVKNRGKFGTIEISNAGGEIFSIAFNPRYFPRRDLRSKDYVKFVVSIRPHRLQAESVDSNPFTNTIQDLFVK